MRVGPRYRTVWRSVVRVGTVQVSVTRSPLRPARRSEGGFGSSSDGGSGGPVWAHPESRTLRAVAKPRLRVRGVIGRERVSEVRFGPSGIHQKRRGTARLYRSIKTTVGAASRITPSIPSTPVPPRGRLCCANLRPRARSRETSEPCCGRASAGCRGSWRRGA
jgi:hypothetical protein